jgi:hypothetical protein
MSYITDKTISRLFGLASGRCSICKTQVVKQEVKIGEMAHIIAKNKGGPRGDFSFDGDINAYENLILLCPNHHEEVDDNPSEWPPEKLHRIKTEHEAYCNNLFEQDSQARTMDVAGLHGLMRYLPFIYMVNLTEALPNRFDNRLYYVSETFDNFARGNPQCRPFSDAVLEAHYIKFVQAVEALIEYEEQSTINDKHVYLPGHLINADSNWSYLNRELDIAERNEASSEVQALLRALWDVYRPFVEYLRQNYREVNIASFVGW